MQASVEDPSNLASYPGVSGVPIKQPRRTPQPRGSSLKHSDLRSSAEQDLGHLPGVRFFCVVVCLEHTTIKIINLGWNSCQT